MAAGGSASSSVSATKCRPRSAAGNPSENSGHGEKERRTMRKTMLALVVLAAALCLPAGGTAAQPAKARDAMITGAKTAADHEALAAQYDKDAADAKAKATEHLKMGAAYKGQPAVTGGKAQGVSGMPQHCEKLANSYDDQAQMSTAMAAGERELAKAAK